jgi:Uma2 family endonuclease
MSETIRRWTFENYERGNFHRGEMVDGWPISAKAGRHGLGDFRRTIVVGSLIWYLGQYVVPRRLGVVVPSAGFFPAEGPALIPPDVAYYPGDRLPPESTWDGLCQAVPDLVADVRSAVDEVAGEWFDEQDAKLVDAYLEAGARLAWVIDALQRTVQIRRPDGSRDQLTFDDSLDGEEVLPGFQLAVADLFRPPVPAR